MSLWVVSTKPAENHILVPWRRIIYAIRCSDRGLFFVRALIFIGFRSCLVGLGIGVWVFSLGEPRISSKANRDCWGCRRPERIRRRGLWVAGSFCGWEQLLTIFLLLMFWLLTVQVRIYSAILRGF